MASSFKTTSGLLDHFEQDIEEFWFGPNPNAKAEGASDSVYAIIRGKAVDLETDEEVEENTLYLGLGKDWKAVKSGEEVTNTSGRGQFHNRSGFGRFIDSAIAAGGDELLDLLESRGEAYQAATWLGLRFRFQRKEDSFIPRGGGEKVTFSYLVVEEYLGEIEGTAKKAPARKTPAKKAAPARKAPAKKKAAEDGDLRSALVAFASQYEEDDFDQFIADVYDADTFDRAAELEDDEELANAVLDEDDIWAEAH